jgi:hypothetical protein
MRWRGAHSAPARGAATWRARAAPYAPGCPPKAPVPVVPQNSSRSRSSSSCVIGFACAQGGGGPKGCGGAGARAHGCEQHAVWLTQSARRRTLRAGLPSASALGDDAKHPLCASHGVTPQRSAQARRCTRAARAPSRPVYRMRAHAGSASAVACMSRHAARSRCPAARLPRRRARARLPLPARRLALRCTPRCAACR